jgi:hypothetical protein
VKKTGLSFASGGEAWTNPRSNRVSQNYTASMKKREESQGFARVCYTSETLTDAFAMVCYQAD